MSYCPKRFLALLGLLFFPLGYNACGQHERFSDTRTQKGSTSGNPMTVFSVLPYSPAAAQGGVALCLDKVILKSPGKSDVELRFTTQSERAIPVDGIDLDILAVPSGSYSEVQLQVSDSCQTDRSLEVTNPQGIFETSQTVNLDFVGDIEVAASTKKIAFDIQPIVDKLDTAASNTEVPVKAVQSSGVVSTPDTWSPMSLAGAPALRARHSTVYTGTEMIVFGGATYPFFAQRGDGGRYDLATNTWISLSTAGAPSARIQHGAFWTGNEMIVWGGNDGVGTQFNTGARFNPTSDTWAPMSTVGAPSPRSLYSGVFTGTEMIVFGGEDSSGPVTGGGRYNPSTNSWSAMSTISQPTPCVAQPAVWTGTEMIIWGCGLNKNAGARYNPATNTWAPMNPVGAPSGRKIFTAVWTGNEMLIWGGDDASAMGLANGARYNPATDTWTNISIINAPAPRSYHTAHWTGSRMIVWGGYNGSFASPQIYYKDGASYDPATDTWSPIEIIGAPEGRLYQSSVYTGSEMLIWGGATETGIHPGDNGRYLP
jgi:N-acetylneuraminic acid mutarotase